MSTLKAVLCLFLCAGCISSKTVFQDYSDLGSAPFFYIEKNAVVSHKTERAVCLFQSNAFQGIGPLYRSLHNQYRLDDNQTFVNQRHDVVNVFGIFYCSKEYFLWADIVEFEHGPTKRPATKAPTTSSPKPPLVAAPPPAPVTNPTTKKVFVTADAPLSVACFGQQEITGQPRSKDSEAVITFPLPRRTNCIIEVDEKTQQISISPGDYIQCEAGRTPQQCLRR